MDIKDSRKVLPLNPNQKGETLCESNKSTNATKENRTKGGDYSRRRAQAKKQKALERHLYEGDNV